MRKHLLPIVLSVLLLTAVSVLLIQREHTHAVERTLEELYQSALNETSEELQSLSIALEKVLVSEDAAQRVRLLTQASRMAEGVRRNLTLLPLSHEAMSPTLTFANQLADYTATLLPLLAEEGTLPPEDADRLSAQLSTCTQLSSQLLLSRQTLSDRSLSLRAEDSVFTADTSAAQRPLEGLSDPDNGMSYPTLIYDGAFSDARHLGQAKGLPTGDITEAEALTIARAFVGEDRVTDAYAAPSTTGVLPAYGVTVLTSDAQLNLEITRQGGKLLWMMPESASFPMTQSVTACQEAAAAFLTARGFDPLEPTYHQVYDGLCVINFAAVQDGVLLYPDLVKAQVRMDTAQVVGMEANNYWMNHVPRTLAEPALSLADARARLSDALSEERSRLCLIPYRGSERLCWEFSVTRGDGQYLIYLDAATGEEVELLKLIPVENGILTA